MTLFASKESSARVTGLTRVANNPIKEKDMAKKGNSGKKIRIWCRESGARYEMKKTKKSTQPKK